MAALSDLDRIRIVSAVADPATAAAVVDRLAPLSAGSATTFGVFNVTAAARASAYTQTYSTADKTHANMTSAAMPAGGAGAAAGAWDTAANRDQAIAEFAALRNDVIDLKQLVNSIIDDLQLYGLLQ